MVDVLESSDMECYCKDNTSVWIITVKVMTPNLSLTTGKIKIIIWHN